eukprot:3714529-Rhodomonas_salina.1
MQRHLPAQVGAYSALLVLYGDAEELLQHLVLVYPDTQYKSTLKRSTRLPNTGYGALLTSPRIWCYADMAYGHTGLDSVRAAALSPTRRPQR